MAKSVKVESGYDTYSSAEAIDNSVWDHVNPNNSLFFRKDYFIAMEKAMPADLSSRYLVLFEEGFPIALFYFQIINLSLQKSNTVLNLDSASKLFKVLSKPLSYLFEAAGGEQERVIIVGGTALMSGEFIYCKSDSISDKKVFEELPALIEIVKTQVINEGKKVAGVLVKDFLRETAEQNPKFKREGYHTLNVDPNMILSLDSSWNSFEDYLVALSSKYRVRIRKTLKIGEAFEIRKLSTNDIKEQSEIIDFLYNSVQNKSSARLTTLDASYFEILSRELPDNFSFKAYYLDGTMVGFMTELFDRDHFEAHYIGLSYEHIKSHSLYQHILIEFIKDAIKAGASKICYGRTAMEIKSNLGAEPYELIIYVKLNNTITNKLIGPFVPQRPLKNWIQRRPFKEIN